MSSIIFAGSAQFIFTQLYAGGATALVLIATGVVVNLRHALYSASIAPYMKHLPARWKWILAYLLTDEAYAVAITYYRTSDNSTDQVSYDDKHWFTLGAGLALWTVWQLSTAAGIFLGAQIPTNWSLDFAVALTFIALVVPVLKDRADVAAGITAGVVSILAFGLPLKLGLLVAALAGILVGMWFEVRR
jgi:predicted branched-subunit amino acid permease